MPVGMLFLYSSYIRPICVLYKTYINRLGWVGNTGLGGGYFFRTGTGKVLFLFGNMFITINNSGWIFFIAVNDL